MASERQQRKQSKGLKIGGALFGFGIFITSIFILWNNEGRINFGEVAKESVSFNASAANGGQTGELVAAYGDLTSDEVVGDPLFIEAQPYIQLKREVEMFAWTESEQTEDDETYYEYDAEWASWPENSDNFYDTSYHNPSMPFESATFTVGSAQVGQYRIDTRDITLPEGNPLDLYQERLVAEIDGNQDISNTGSFIYVGFNTIDNPDIGDLRVSFRAVPQAQNVTVFGAVSGERIVPYIVEDDELLYRAFFSSRESAILTMEEEYSTALWGTRYMGFFMMWCGIFLVANPITILVSFFPALRKASGYLLGLIALPIAALLATLIISVSFLAHNPLALVGLIVLALLVVGGGIGGVYWWDKRKKEESTN